MKPKNALVEESIDWFDEVLRMHARLIRMLHSRLLRRLDDDDESKASRNASRCSFPTFDRVRKKDLSFYSFSPINIDNVRESQMSVQSTFRLRIVWWREDWWRRIHEMCRAEPSRVTHDLFPPIPTGEVLHLSIPAVSRTRKKTNPRLIHDAILRVSWPVRFQSLTVTNLIEIERERERQSAR